jgi:nucleoid-associated protein YgaU
MMTVFMLVGAVTLIGCNNNMKKGDDKAPPPPTLAHPRLAPAPIPMATVSPTPEPALAPAPVPVPTDVVAGGKGYILKKGDTLSKIAREQFGGLNHLRDLINANPGIDPNKIHPGQKINLP